MNERTEALYRLIVEIRGAFNELKAYSDAANADIGVTAAMRAVMEYLAANGATSVPDIARAKSVSRQHIQQLADALAADGLLQWNDNPRHKRSPLACLTPAGAARFEEIRKREAGALSDIEAAMPDIDLTAAAGTVRALRDVIRRSAEK